MADAPRPAAARARRRPRRLGLVLLLLAALWLAGRGLGWLGGAPVPTRGEPEPAEAVASEVEPRAAGAEPEDAPANSAGADVPPAPTAELAAMSSEALAPTEPVAAGDAANAPPIDADRFGSMLSLIDLRLQQGEVGRAMVVLEQLQQWALLPAQRAELATRRASGDEALQQCVLEVSRRLTLGEVRLAAALVRSLLAGGAASREHLQKLPCGAQPERQIAAPRERWRQPEPLAKGRMVRLLQGDTSRIGSVVDSRSDRLTLRVAHAQGVTFPTVAMSAVEPLEPTPNEAVAMGWASLQAGELLVARLWLACAELRGAGQTAPGVVELAEVMR